MGNPKPPIDPSSITREQICPYINDRYTLLCSPNQLPPPQSISNNHNLYTLLRDAPHLYQRMLGLISLGSTWHVAAQSIGVAKQTLQAWVKRGNKAIYYDEDGEQISEDSYFVRLSIDIRRAIAVARTGAELEVKKQNPLAYLRIGPGRALGDEWRDDPTTKTQVEHTHQSNKPNPLLPEDNVEQLAEQERLEQELLEYHKAPINNSTKAAAFLELQKAGIIKIPEGQQAHFEKTAKEGQDNAEDIPDTP